MKQIGTESKAFSLLVLFRIAPECHLKNDIPSAPLGIVTFHRPREPSVELITRFLHINFWFQVR